MTLPEACLWVLGVALRVACVVDLDVMSRVPGVRQDYYGLLVEIESVRHSSVCVSFVEEVCMQLDVSLCQMPHLSVLEEISRLPHQGCP